MATATLTRRPGRGVLAAVTGRGFRVTDDNEADAIAILPWATETAGRA